MLYSSLAAFPWESRPRSSAFSADAISTQMTTTFSRQHTNVNTLVTLGGEYSTVYAPGAI